MRKPRKFLLGTALGILTVLLGNAGLHLTLGFCPLAGQRFPSKQWIPVIYGLPSEQGLEAAREGKVSLGGCSAGTVKSLCPRCRWPMVLRDLNES